MNNNQPTAIFLVGPPGSGKSTYAAPFLAMGYRHISTDAYIEDIAAAKGITYGEAWKDAINAAEKNMKANVIDAISKREMILWDQTNLTVKSRAGKITKLLAAGYNVIAVAFELSPEELRRRQDARKAETGKFIPYGFVASMLKGYLRPTVDEGFSEISIISD